jgi:hypothetical protein
MATNPNKSGIIYFGASDTSVNGEVLGYPILDSYKHLGSIINKRLNTKDHLNHIQPKIQHITNRLTPVRLKRDTKLYLNLFRVFILPLYRLAANNYSKCDLRDKQLTTKHLGKSFKRFMAWPANTSGRMINLVLGDPDSILTNAAAISKEKDTARRTGRPVRR